MQDEVRAAFGWSVEDDQNSALALHAQMSAVAPYGVEGWAAQARDAALRDLLARCRAASRVVVVGAAATVEDVNAAAGPETIFVAADGAAGRYRMCSRWWPWSATLTVAFISTMRCSAA